MRTRGSLMTLVGLLPVAGLVGLGLGAPAGAAGSAGAAPSPSTAAPGVHVSVAGVGPSARPAPQFARRTVPTAFVASYHTAMVTPIEMPSGTTFVVEPSIGLPTPSSVHGIEASPTGSTVYAGVTSNYVQQGLYTIDTGGNTVSGVYTAGKAPFGVAVSPDGGVAMSANAQSDSVTEVTTSTKKAYQVPLTSVLGGGPLFVAFAPTSKKAYVAADTNTHHGALVTVTVDTLKPVTAFPLNKTGGTPITGGTGGGGCNQVGGIAVTPVGTTALVVCESLATVYEVSLATHAVTTLRLDHTVGVGHAEQVAFLPDGNQALITWETANESTAANLTVLDLRGNTQQVLSLPHAGFTPQGLTNGGIAVSPTGTLALVASRTATAVYVVHLTSTPPTVDPTTIPVGGGPAMVTFAKAPYAPVIGYWEVASDGGIFSFGDATFYGSMGGHPLNQPIVDVAATADGRGYWEVASDGGLFAFGNAQFYGSMGGHPLNKPIVGMAATPTGGGYWEVASDGGLFAFGNAQFCGSMGGHPLNEPIVGMAATPTGGGYWEVASDGGLFAFGNAQFYGSMGGHPLNKPVVALATTPDGKGYWEVASDGGLFAFGDAQFYGSMGGQPLNQPIAGLLTSGDGQGYWELASDGGLFAFGDARFYGSMGGQPLNRPVVAIGGAY